MLFRPDMEKQKWHTLGVDDVLKDVNTTTRGLSTEEAEERLRQYGPNEIAAKKQASDLELFLGQFKNVLVAVLIFAIGASLFLGEIIDAAVIAVILVINALLGFYQERKAEHALAALKKLATTKSNVVRNGKQTTLDSKLLVPGDIILLNAGDKVPADCRIIEQYNTKMDESLLTGESVPVTKDAQTLGDVVLPERINMAFSGTSVVYGKCTAVVAETGMQTEFGKIAEKLQGKEEDTPLQRRLAVLGKQLSLVILAVAVIVFAAGYLHGIGLFEMFLVAVSLAVAAIPEGLPAIVTITLAIGLMRMSKKRAIVRRLSAVESLGSVTVICCDKTGTLTKNEMTVRKIFVNDDVIDFDNTDNKKDSTLDLLLLTGLLCNDATEQSGDPTEIALIRSAKKYGLEDVREREKRLNEIPFESERKMMSVVYDVQGKKMFTKGAVEEILKQCNKIYRDTPGIMTNSDRQKILETNEQLTKDALRVLAFAYKPVSDIHAKEDELIFVGLQAMIDPPRPEVKDAIAKCYTAGIKVVMITGDHQNTAEAIARELGIAGRSVTGAELEKMNDKALEDTIDSISVYARTSPDQKVRITEMLRKKGHIVAMSGDGVNDAPALKKSDIGIAVGSGTDVTKETADMVLTDDNFATIVDAVEEGRGIYDNIKKFVNYLLSANFAEILVILTAIIINMPLPLLPLQILWMNLLTDGLPALALGIEQPDKDVMKRKPRDPKEKILNRSSITYILLVGILLAAVILILFNYYLPDVPRARTIAFTALVIGELFVAMSFRSTMRISKAGYFTNRKFLAAVLTSLLLQLAVVYIPGLNTAFGTVPLGLQDWNIIFGAGIAVYIVLEALKGKIGR